LQVNTFTDFLAKKHSESGLAIRIVASITIVFFFFFYVGAQFMGGGKTLHTLFGIRADLGMFITAIIIIPYTIYGGFKSVVYTDVIQAILMIITLIVCPIVGVIYIKNNPDLFAQSIGMALAKAGNGYFSLTGAAKGFSAGLIIVSGFSWFFGYLGGQPQLSTRFMAIKDVPNAKLGRNIGIAWTLLAYIGALCIGWLGIAIFGPQALKDQEYVMPSVVLHLFPSILAALLMVGAIAAMVSTADSLLVVSATELSENIIKPLLRFYGKAKNVNSLLLSRLITGILAAIALLTAYLSPTKLIFTIVGWVWAGVGCTFSVVVIFTLFWRKFHSRAALITIITGLLFTIIWGITGMEIKITARILTFCVATITAVIATYSSQKP
jgi:sodium/proline symporter